MDVLRQIFYPYTGRLRKKSMTSWYQSLFQVSIRMSKRRQFSLNRLFSFTIHDCSLTQMGNLSDVSPVYFIYEYLNCYDQERYTWLHFHVGFVEWSDLWPKITERILVTTHKMGDTATDPSGDTAGGVNGHIQHLENTPVAGEVFSMLGKCQFKI